MVVSHRNRLPREVVDAPRLSVLKGHSGNLIEDISWKWQTKLSSEHVTIWSRRYLAPHFAFECKKVFIRLAENILLEHKLKYSLSSSYNIKLLIALSGTNGKNKLHLPELWKMMDFKLPHNHLCLIQLCV